jgi:WD40 repeat protein
MSPEQAAGRLDQLGPASDTYSLGATLYCLLTGKTPFPEKDVGAVLARVQKGDFEPPRQVNASVPAALEAVCLKAMALKAQERYCSARELAEEIEHWLADEPVKAYPEPRRARLARWGRRHKPLVAGAAALLLTAVVALSLGLVLLGQANTEIQEQRNQALQRKREADDAKEQAETQRDELARLNDSLLRANYISDMNLARVAWDENNLDRGRELLDRHAPRQGEKDQRGFEWHYLHRLLHGHELIIKAHGGAVTAVAFTPDGKRLISSGTREPPRGMQGFKDSRGEVKQWDAATGQPLAFQLRGQTERAGALTVFGDRVYGMALNPNGTLMAASCRDHAIRIWDFATGKLCTLEGPATHIASGQIGAGMNFSPDGKRLVSVHRRESASLFQAPEVAVKIWDLSSHKAVVTLDHSRGSVLEPSFSPDGKLLAAACRSPNVVKVWDATTGRIAYECKYVGGMIGNAVFNPEGNRLAACGENGIQIWDTATHQSVATFRADASFGWCLAFSPDGTRLAMGTIEGVLEVWDTRAGEKIQTFKGHFGGVRALVFSPDGKRLATGGADGTLRVWDLIGQRDTLSIPNPDGALGFPDLSPDGRTLMYRYSRNDGVRLWDTTTGQPRGGPIRLAKTLIHSAWSAHGERLYLVDGTNTITVIDVASANVVRTFQIDADQDQLRFAFSPDEKCCAHSSGPGAKVIKVRNFRTGAHLHTLKGLDERVHDLVFSPDGSRLLAADVGGTLKIWELATGREVAATKIGGIYMNGIEFSPDGKRVAVVGNLSRLLSGEARILDAENLREVWSLRGHTLNVTDAVFSPDGERLATSSADRTIRLWDLATGQEMLKLSGFKGIMSLRFNSDSRRLMSASRDGTIRVWDAAPLPE